MYIYYDNNNDNNNIDCKFKSDLNILLGNIIDNIF
jgi:hypothetical protein